MGETMAQLDISLHQIKPLLLSRNGVYLIELLAKGGLIETPPNSGYWLQKLMVRPRC